MSNEWMDEWMNQSSYQSCLNVVGSECTDSEIWRNLESFGNEPGGLK